MLQFKLWFLTYGIILTAWIAMGAGIGFFIWAKWEKGRAAKLAGAFMLVIFALIIFIYQTEPWNWQLMRSIGGIK